MRIAIKIMLGLLISGILLTSCKKDFLEVIPKGSLIATTAADYDLLLSFNGFYFNSAVDGSYMLPLALGDEVAAEGSLFGNTNIHMQRAFRWEPVIYEPTEEPYYIGTQLSLLYTCNKVIEEVMNGAGDELQKRQLLAEAKAGRAFLYFHLINLFGKPYNAATAATDPGFPLITRADVTGNHYTRASVQAIYDLVVSDLQAAIPDLPLTGKPRVRILKSGAEGLLGKVYLFMGKPAAALPFLNAAFTDMAAQPTPPRLYDYNVELAPGGSFLPVSPTAGPVNPGNKYDDLTESLMAKTFYSGTGRSNINVFYGNSALVLTPEAAALFTATDKRLQLYSANKPDGSPNPGGRIRKYAVTYTKFGLQLPELYLLSAECKARTNDLAGAKADVEYLRNRRMPNADALVPTAIAGDQASLIRFIIDERIREFAAEGYRWFDMRRLSTDPLFSALVYKHTIYADAGNEVITLTPERLVLRLPPYYLDKNPEMRDNP